MKISPASILLATVLSASVLSAATKNDSPVVYSADKVTLSSSRGSEQITRGDSRERVRALMDCPNQELSRNVWLYYGFSADSQSANEQGCRTMVITFADEKVVDLQFVNKPAAGIIAANLKPSPAARNVASSK